MVDWHAEFGDSRIFHEKRMDRRSVDELAGLAAGITADGHINQVPTGLDCYEPGPS